MDNIFEQFSIWLKRFFLVATFLALAWLNVKMLNDVFAARIEFVITGFLFFSFATWVYLVDALSVGDGEGDDERKSSNQVFLAWVGLILSAIGELSLATLEIMRMQMFVAIPDWLSTAVIMIIEAAIILHAILGVAYLAAAARYNKALNKLFERSRRLATEEKTRRAIAKVDLEIRDETAVQTINLTRSMLQATLPIIAKKQSIEMATDIAKTFGMDADPAVAAAFSQAIDDYMSRQQTMAMSRATIIDATAHEPSQNFTSAAGPNQQA